MQIEEVILSTNSISRTKQFYARTLELPLVKETGDAVSFQAGISLLTFKLTEIKKPFYHFAFNVTNNKFSDSFDWVNSKLDILPVETGLPIAVYTDWNAQSFYFHDNNCNILEFMVRFDLPYYSADPFSVNDIREICEVGIVSDNVPGTASKLQSEFGLPYFSRSKPTETFTVLGDDHGLLIITKTGRGWVPTHRPAQIFPLTVIADGKTITSGSVEA